MGTPASLRVRSEDQQGAKKAERKSKKSWELVPPSLLKSALPAKKEVRKSKKSWLVTEPSLFQSPGQAASQRKP